MKLIPAHWLYSSWPWYLSGGLILVPFLAEIYLIEWLVLTVVLAGLFILTPKRSFIIAGLLLALGGVWGSVWGGLILDRGLPTALVKQDILVRGVILNLPQQRSHALRFKFEITSVTFNDQAHDFSGPVLLSWYDKPYPDLQVGDQWQLMVRLKPAHGALNPGGFSYEKWLFSQGIRATGYVRDSDKAQLLEAEGIWYFADRFRARVKQFIAAQNLSMGGIISALSIGERSDISEQQWQVFRDTGTAHLIAISGLHIGLVAGLAFFLTQFLWRHSLLVPTMFPAQHVARLTALITAVSYAALAGFALPTLRAFIMLLAYFSLQWLQRSPSTLFTLGFVLMVVLIFDPLAPLGAGLWLSFGAVAAIAYSVSASNQPADNPDQADPEHPHFHQLIGKRLIQWIRIQWAVFLGLMPFLLLFFGQFSIISLLANAIAIPLIGMLLVPIILLAVLWFALGWPSVASSLFTFADELLSMIWPVLEKFSALPFAVWQDAPPPGWTVALATFGALILLTPKLARKRALGALGFIPLFLPYNSAPAHDTFLVQVLDVGQGLAIMVRTQKHTLLYDAGIKYKDGFDAGSATILPFLQQYGIQSLDVLIASHQNIDHYGGLAAISKKHPAAQKFSSAAFYADSSPCTRGINWQWEGVKFTFLHPSAKNLGSDNNDSCVLRISSRFGSILLTGDIEHAAERVLLETSKNKLQADVLLAPHHGSRSSSGESFIGQLKPKLVIISAGYLNRFNHPHAQVIQRYLDQDIAMLNTATSGAIRITFDASGIQASPWRAKQKRYWRANFAESVPIKLTPNQLE